MKRIVIFSMIIFTNLYLFAQVDIIGNLETKTRFGFTGEDRITWSRNILTLNLTSNITEGAGLFSDIRFVHDGFPKQEKVSNYLKNSLELTQPLSIEFREAFIDLYAFPLHNVDIRIGKQRIAWGTADKFNPTDNINPDKLDDIYEFGDHFGSTAFNIKWYSGQFTTQLIYTPTFSPAVLPKGDWINAFINYNVPDTILQQFPQYNPLDIFDYINIDNRVKNTSSFAFKISTMLFGYDLSLSFYKGREDIPVLDYNNVYKFFDTISKYDPNTPISFEYGPLFLYPRKSVIGIDFAGSIKNIGIWGEFAYTDMQEVIDAGGKFIKYVLGFDYTTAYNLYINFQYIHGFLHEMRKDNLNDYFSFRLEKNFPYKNFKLILLSGLASVSDWDNIKESYGFTVGPGLEIRPSDGVELTIGTYIIDAKPESFFYNVKDLDEVYLNVKYSF